MRRDERQTIARGLPGEARRRCERLLARVRARTQYVRTRHEIRDARRLADAGLICAAVSKGRFIGALELALFASETEARRRYKVLLPQRRKLGR